MLSFGISWALSYFCAVVWPTYAGFKAIGTNDKQDDTQWLTYFVTYSILTTCESVASGFIAWFPLYYEIRLLFVLWLVLPQTKGAQLIFEKIISPLMHQYGARIDPAFQQAEKIMNSPQVAQMVKLSEKYGPQIAQQAMQRATEEAQRLAASQGGSVNGARHAQHHQAPPGYSQPSFGGQQRRF